MTDKEMEKEIAAAIRILKDHGYKVDFNRLELYTGIQEAEVNFIFNFKK